MGKSIGELSRLNLPTLVVERKCQVSCITEKSLDRCTSQMLMYLKTTGYESTEQQIK
jgi:hypothetical protein